MVFTDTLMMGKLGPANWPPAIGRGQLFFVSIFCVGVAQPDRHPPVPATTRVTHPPWCRQPGLASGLLLWNLGAAALALNSAASGGDTVSLPPLVVRPARLPPGLPWPARLPGGHRQPEPGNHRSIGGAAVTSPSCLIRWFDLPPWAAGISLVTALVLTSRPCCCSSCCATRPAAAYRWPAACCAPAPPGRAAQAAAPPGPADRRYLCGGSACLPSPPLCGAIGNDAGRADRHHVGVRGASWCRWASRHHLHVSQHYGARPWPTRAAPGAWASGGACCMLVFALLFWLAQVGGRLFLDHRDRSSPLWWRWP